MPAFPRKYTDAQRDAVARAILDLNIRPVRRVVALAAAGELADGLEPFTVPIDTARDMVRQERKRRRARNLAAEPASAAAAIDQLRADLIHACRCELADITRLRKTTDIADHAAASKRAERMRQFSRALREAAAIPDSTRPSPSPGVRPGQRDPAADGKHTPGQRDLPATTLGGGILAAHRGTNAAAPVDTAPSTDTAHTHRAQADAAPDASPNNPAQRTTSPAGTTSYPQPEPQTTITDQQPGADASAEVQRRMLLAQQAAAGHMGVA